MDAADREPGGHDHRIDMSLLLLKKRASNYSSGLGRTASGDPYASSYKKKRVDDTSALAETKDTAGASEAPVPRQRRPVPAPASREPTAELPAPAAASPKPAAEGNIWNLNASSESDEEKKRLSKRKWLAREDSSRSLVTVTPQPPVKKLMHDGIRSFVPLPQQLRDEHRYAAAAAEEDDDVPLPLHGSPALSSALKRRLAELGATRPWLVHSKTLHKSDVDENQNRLLVSCKRGSGTEDCPITRCFSPAELERVNKKHAGLAVTALDRDGVQYALTCKFLDSNNGYRFISEWKHFLIRNGMNLDSQRHKVWTRDVEVELWAFRSRQLPYQPQLDAEGKVVTVTTKDEDGKKVTVVQRVCHHLDADGALGLLLLHHENRRRRVKSEEKEDDDDWEGPSSPPSVARKKGKRGASGSSSALASPVALPAPVAEQGEARRLTFYAAVGLAKLRRAIWERWQEHADQGHGAKGSNDDVARSRADVEGEKIDNKK
uniref:N-alpha-acetyltransferase 50 n=1 Tax=Saccharum hybrid cultivar SP80-3280 TaxID=193079 RepID=A0A2R4QN49_9POAL|nr:N-alpha-acetyltransferase 50 [Saccharum hybrid cultivar SP80-3280]